MLTIGVMIDQPADGRRFRILTVVDHVSRECMCLKVTQSLPTQAVTEALDEAIGACGQPEAITMGNGMEFTCTYLDHWAYQRGIQLDFVTPRRPLEDSSIEGFYGKAVRW